MDPQWGRKGHSLEAGVAHAFKDFTVYTALQVMGSSGEKQSIKEKQGGERGAEEELSEWCKSEDRTVPFCLLTHTVKTIQRI